MLLRSVARRSPRSTLARCWHDVASPGRLGSASAAGAPRPVRFYLRLLHEQPFATVAAASTFSAAAGDLAAQLAWMLGVRVRGVGIGDEARFGHGGVSLSAIAALSVPSTLQGVNPEMGLMRTMRFAILSGVAVGCAGEMWFRRLLRKMPGFTYEAMLRGVFDQVRTP